MAERTTREVIRAAIDEWALVWREGSDRGYVPMLETPLADLTDRIVAALAGETQGFVGYLNTEEGRRRFPKGRFPPKT